MANRMKKEEGALSRHPTEEKEVMMAYRTKTEPSLTILEEHTIIVGGTTVGDEILLARGLQQAKQSRDDAAYQLVGNLNDPFKKDGGGKAAGILRSPRRSSVSCFSLALMLLLFCVAGVRGGEVNNPAFDAAVQEDDEAAIRGYIKEDPSLLDYIGIGGQSPLVHAVLAGKLNAVKTLLDLGADTTLTEKDGYNVLHAAGFQGRAEILSVLLEKVEGLDPRTDQHEDGFYPIHRACWGREQRHTDTVQVFLENGVPPDIKAKNGNTCLDMTHNEGTKTVLLKAIETNQEL